MNNLTPIPNYPNYACDKDGNIYSLKRNKLRKLNGYISSKGYVRLCLRKDNKKVTVTAHRLIAMTFINNPSNKPQVNHINGIKTDNSVDNLEWCTQAENNKHAYDTGLNKGNINHPKISKPVRGINIKTGEEIVFSSCREAHRNGFNKGCRKLSKGC